MEIKKCKSKFKNYLQVYKIARYLTFIIFMYQIIELTTKYLMYKTVLKMEFKVSDEREFPTVTICVNMFDNDDNFPDLVDFAIAVPLAGTVGLFVFPIRNLFIPAGVIGKFARVNP